MTNRADTSEAVQVHIGSLSDMGTRFADAWKAAEAGQQVARDNVTFLSLEAFMAAMSPKRLELIRHLRRGGAMSVRRLAAELGRDYKSVHREVAMLIGAGLIERRARDLVAVGWHRLVTELDLAA
jgi:predicted transcriptional regulator